MANIKISDLTAASAAAGANEFEINEAGTSKKVTGSQISAFVKADLLDDTTVNFTGTLQNGGSNVVVDTDIGSTVQAYDADTAKYDDTTANFTGTLQNGGSNVVVDSDIGATGTVGYPNIPAVGTKTSSYTLTTSDVGKYVQVGSGGSITIPDATFDEGDVVSIFNNTTGNVTITCSITTAYKAGTDADIATATLATRGVATILFISGTVCVITGNI